MRKIYAVRAVAAILLIATLFSACGVVEVNSARDRARVIAKVGDKEILKGAFLDLYSQQLSYYGISEDDEEIKSDPQYQSFIKSIKDSIFGYLISGEVVKIMTKRGGHYLDTEEERQAAQLAVDEQIAGYKEQMLFYGEMMGYEGEELEQYALDSWNDMLEENNITVEDIIQEELDNRAVQRFRDAELAGVSISDEEVQAYYDELLDSQRTQYREDAEAYLDALESASEPVVYQPGKGVYVKHILIKIPDEKVTEYNQLVVDSKQDEADKLLEAELAKIKPKADEVLVKAKAVKNEAEFVKLIEQYGEDPGMASDQYKDKGYLAYEGASLTENFLKAALAFKKTGEVSELVETEFGYHILYASNKMVEGARSLESVRTELYQTALTIKKNSVWSEKVEEWIAQLEKERLIKRYENRL